MKNMRILGIPGALVGVAMIVLSCEGARQKSVVDRVIDASIEVQSGELVEFPVLYDTLTHYIPEDKDEKLILVEKLKARGFEQVDYGRGNFPPLGPRVVIVEMKKGDCNCSVRKVYYATVAEETWQMSEAISCEKQADQKQGNE